MRGEESREEGRRIFFFFLYDYRGFSGFVVVEFPGDLECGG